MHTSLWIIVGLCIFSIPSLADFGSAQTPASQPATVPVETEIICMIPGARPIRIAYICDASASMADKLDVAKFELQKSLNCYRQIDTFDIFVSQDNDDHTSQYIALAPDLLPARGDNTKNAADFIKKINPHGVSHVIPALTQAFHLAAKPERIYILTDGVFKDEGSNAVIAAINKLDPDHKMVIQPVLFFHTGMDPAELKAATDAVEKIAGKNGVCSMINIEDVAAEMTRKSGKDTTGQK